MSKELNYYLINPKSIKFRRKCTEFSRLFTPTFFWIQTIIPLGHDIKSISFIFYITTNLITHLLIVIELYYNYFPIQRNLLKFLEFRFFSPQIHTILILD